MVKDIKFNCLGYSGYDDINYGITKSGKIIYGNSEYETGMKNIIKISYAFKKIILLNKHKECYIYDTRNRTIQKLLFKCKDILGDDILFIYCRTFTSCQLHANVKIAVSTVLS